MSRISKLEVAALLLGGLALASGSPVHAQDAAEADGGEEAVSVTASAVVIPEGGATDGDAAIVSIGVRRGMADVAGIDFVHPVDALSPPVISEDLAFAFEELEPLRDQVRDGDARDVLDRADALIEMFEQNLPAVRREQLIDAYMLAAVARCRLSRRRECEEVMGRIVVFREGYEYDVTRFPEAYAEVFAGVRDETLSEARATLEISTEPVGAEVYVDGRSYGPSPVAVPDLLVGDHYITIKHIAFEKAVVRATVERGGSSVSYALAPNERSRLVSSPEALSAIRGELGEERAGSSIRSLGNTLGAAQVVIGVVRPAGDSLHVQLFLYDVRTRFLLGRGEVTLTRDEAGMEEARAAAVELYEGVDHSGAIDAPIDDGPTTRAPEVYEQWWFWTAIGVVAVGIGVGVGVGVATTGPGIPDGWTRIDTQIP